MRKSAPQTSGGQPDLEDCPACLFCAGDVASETIAAVKDLFFRADPGAFDLLRCSHCRSLWLARRPVGDRLVKAYANYYTHDDPLAVEAQASGVRARLREAYYRSRFDRTASLFDRLIVGAIRLSGYNTDGLDRGMRFVPAPPAKVLDYGCGSGTFLMQLARRDYDLHGVEYDPQLLANLAERGITVEDAARLTDARWDREFDHITLSHVLEHVPDPRALLQRLFRWLKPGGGLYLELPNAEATGLAIFGRCWRGLEAPRHFALPSRGALIGALEGAGFIVERQVVDHSARRWIWNQSLGVSPAAQHEHLRQAMEQAPPETEANAELLTFVARRPK